MGLPHYHGKRSCRRKTTIYNAACEPYIQQLCNLLNKWGQRSRDRFKFLIIEGVNKLNGARHKILPDMIEIGSWIGLAAITKRTYN